jgi:hypothetical protein
MKKFVCLAFIFYSQSAHSADSGVVAANIQEYCEIITQSSYPMFLGRVKNSSKEEMIEMQQWMTDPKAIAMVNDVIEYAFEQSDNTTIDELKEGFKAKCLAGELSHQITYNIR